MQHPVEVFSCWPGREPVLAQELLRMNVSAQPEVLAPGFVGVHAPTPGNAPSIAFATQVWPEATPLQATSIKAWAEALLPTLRTIDDESWRLHVFCHDIEGAEVTARRAALIDDAVRALLKQKQRRLLRTLLDRDAQATPWRRNETLVEVALTGRATGFISLVRAPTRKHWRHIISQFSGGVAHPEEDREPPARAYLKLREATMHMGRAPSEEETCVDLGASPGSWTYDALMAGAYVTGIDRSPLREDMMEHPRFTFVKADAFKFAPEARVDWLVCDVIAYPQRNIALLDQWLTEGWCKHFVVTLKFKGADDYAAVDACKEMLHRHGAKFGLRQLGSNKNEVTAYGTARK
jgi:23S rRNA (cytidine2498-2'-O)-methyltransferase